jgi:hypothetical protein
MGLSTSGERRGLFMPHVNPIDRLSPPQCVGNPIEGVDDDAVGTLDTCLLEHLDEKFGPQFCSSTVLTHICPLQRVSA